MIYPEHGLTWLPRTNYSEIFYVEEVGPAQSMRYKLLQVTHVATVVSGSLVKRSWLHTDRGRMGF